MHGISKAKKSHPTHNSNPKASLCRSLTTFSNPERRSLTSLPPQNRPGPLSTWTQTHRMRVTWTGPRRGVGDIGGGDADAHPHATPPRSLDPHRRAKPWGQCGASMRPARWVEHRVPLKPLFRVHCCCAVALIPLPFASLCLCPLGPVRFSGCRFAGIAFWFRWVLDSVRWLRSFGALGISWVFVGWSLDGDF